MSKEVNLVSLIRFAGNNTTNVRMTELICNGKGSTNMMGDVGSLTFVCLFVGERSWGLTYERVRSFQTKSWCAHKSRKIHMHINIQIYQTLLAFVSAPLSMQSHEDGQSRTCDFSQTLFIFIY